VSNFRRSAIGLTVAVPVAIVVLSTPVNSVADASAGKDQSGAPLLRDPFWPVGYWPKSKTDQTDVVVASVSPRPQTDSSAVVQPPPAEDPPKWPDLRPRGIMKMPDGHFEALVEGVKGVVVAGQTVAKVDGKYEYSWRIDSVSATGVRYTRINFRKIK
jgi:hypothetical protein